MPGKLKCTHCESMRLATFNTDDGDDLYLLSASDYVEQLSKADFSAFNEWLKIMSVRMHLAEFDVRISLQHCEAGYVAEVETDFNYHKIKIALCPQFHTFTRERKRTIIVHELLHAHMTAMKVPYESLEMILSSDAYTLTQTTALRMEEHVVSSIEFSLAPAMPLPPVLGKKAPKLSEKVHRTKK